MFLKQKGLWVAEKPPFGRNIYSGHLFFEKNRGYSSVGFVPVAFEATIRSDQSQAREAQCSLIIARPKVSPSGGGRFLLLFFGTSVAQSLGVFLKKWHTEKPLKFKAADRCTFRIS